MDSVINDDVLVKKMVPTAICREY